MIQRQRFLTVLLSFVLMLAFVNGNAVWAQGAQGKQTAVNTSAKASADLKEYSERAQKSAEVLTEIMGIPERDIPEDLMSRAKGIAVIPHVVKGALGFGGRYGKGLMSQRLSNGQWSSPIFVQIGGGSVGLQIGVEATDLVLVFTRSDGVQSLLKGKMTLGADASVAAGPVGRKASVATDVLLKTGVFSYSRSKGLFAGISLDGAALTIDDSANEKVFGKVDPKQIVNSRQNMNPVVMPFVTALERYSPAVRTKTSE
jgi:lipid-binding SYLF domain-containing protein